MPIVPYFRSDCTLEQALSHATEKRSTTYEVPKGLNIEGSTARRQSTKKIRKKKWKLYDATPIPEMGSITEFHETEDGRTYTRVRPESFKNHQSRALRIMMGKSIFPVMNRAWREEGRVITDQEIRDHLDAVILDLCDAVKIPHPVSSYDQFTGGSDATSMTWDTVDRLMSEAIAYCRENWDESVDRNIRERARAGGRAYKSYNLDAHLATAHMGVTAAARHLGISRNSVYRMREEYADINITTGESNGSQAQEETPPKEPVESDRLRSEPGEDSESPTDTMDGIEQNRGKGSTASDDRTEGLREELARLKLPY